MENLKEMDGKMYYFWYSPTGWYDNEWDFDRIEIKWEKNIAKAKEILLLNNNNNGKDSKD